MDRPSGGCKELADCGGSTGFIVHTFYLLTCLLIVT